MRVPEEAKQIINSRLSKGGRELLFLAVSGSHAWGLEQPDSDVDIRGVYQDPTTKVLGIYKGDDNMEFNDGIYDVQLYELQKFLRLLCNHNGNMVNLLWLPEPSIFSIGVPWGFLAQKFITKKLRFYYRGYAESQRKRAMSQRGGKALIYTYREMFSGLYTLRYGVMEHNFMKLWDEAVKNNWYQGELLGQYFPDPSQEVTDEGWHKFYSEWDKLCIVLDEEVEKSSLPLTYDGVKDCTDILVSQRLLNLFSEKLATKSNGA